MKNQPLFVSIIIGIIVVFVIVGASLVAKLSNINKLYKAQALKNMELSKENDSLKKKINSLIEENDSLKKENSTLEGVVKDLKEDITAKTVEIDKLKKLNEVLEEKLKDELMKESSSSQNPAKPMQQK